MSLLLACLFFCAFSSPPVFKGENAPPERDVVFDECFVEGALRLDVVHSGTDSDERVALRRVIREPFWAGSRAHLIPESRMGTYCLDVRDGATGRLIYRRGFSTLFSEWRTTAEAKTTPRAFEETYEMPYPKNPVDIEVTRGRDEGGEESLFAMTFDPGSSLVARSSASRWIKVHELVIHGDPAGKVDLLILGDGYTASEGEKFAGDCEHVVHEFFGVEPLRSYRDRFNVRAVQIASAESGVDEPRKGVFRDTAFGMSFNTFGSERYCMTENVWAVHDAASLAPHDAILLMANSSRYGGGAIYNFYTAFVSDNEYDDYLCVHEFGHGFGGLADEYFSSEVSYNEFYPRGVEPWEPNITALLDPTCPKWTDLIEPGTPIPTPADDPMYTGIVGVFEGAGYAAKGLYRPAVDCRMFSKGNREFCEVCSHALIETIRFYAAE